MALLKSAICNYLIDHSLRAVKNATYRIENVYDVGGMMCGLYLQTLFVMIL